MCGKQGTEVIVIKIYDQVQNECEITKAIRRRRITQKSWRSAVIEHVECINAPRNYHSYLYTHLHLHVKEETLHINNLNARVAQQAASNQTDETVLIFSEPISEGRNRPPGLLEKQIRAISKHVLSSGSTSIGPRGLQQRPPELLRVFLIMGARTDGSDLTERLSQAES